jgi:hypothetical protein
MNDNVKGIIVAARESEEVKQEQMTAASGGCS